MSCSKVNIEIIDTTAVEPVVLEVVEMANTVWCDGLKSTYPTATTPLADEDKVIVRQGNEWKEADKSQFGGGGGTPEVKRYFQWKKSNTSLVKLAWTRVSLQVKDFDTDNVFNGNTFTVAKKGIYHIGGAFTIKSLSDGKKMVIFAYKNGVKFYMIGRGTAGGTDYAGFAGSFMCQLKVGDKIDVRIYHTNSADERLTDLEDGYNYFYANLIKEL